jgi:hypothetical protein
MVVVCIQTGTQYVQWTRVGCQTTRVYSFTYLIDLGFPLLVPELD